MYLHLSNPTKILSVPHRTLDCIYSFLPQYLNVSHSLHVLRLLCFFWGHFTCIAGSRTNTRLQVLQGVEERQVRVLHHRECPHPVPDVPRGRLRLQQWTMSWLARDPDLPLPGKSPKVIIGN